MHGLINRSLQIFLQDNYGPAKWVEMSKKAGAPTEGFEAMLSYDTGVTHALLESAESVLGKPRAALLEDLGSFIVSHGNEERVRRLLRFGGEDFVGFLHSLEDLRDRAQLAVPDLDMPVIEVRDEPPTRFQLICSEPFPGTSQVLQGVLWAMADDYGALVLIDLVPPSKPGEAAEISIELLDSSHTEGRSFRLASGAG
ncbi:hypothetical protein ACMU_11535 [Actibacterium mucosum KCTC 23349]|uniref:Heme NO-binding domain-containing protein n=1 Tax=Actibacterium mucosum KCTC 23349 TaxID=1454373 RepID=A0A037ZIE6_9RHOB|nr:heme NO-binding domain-containing protein [Actibacterium mucosum]KAJ55322.1 hypothetical protein ACMU_11535 [Actibacterium mucosum KCTC 23349]